MAKKTFLLFIVFVLSTGLFAQEKGGTVLLDKLSLLFKGYAEHGIAGGKGQVDKDLEGLMIEASRTRDKMQIDSVFFRRYHRILLILKLAITESEGGILGSLVDREIKDFVEDITGERLDHTGIKAIGAVANAVATEILNLHLYPDTVKARDKLMKEFEKKYGVKN